VTLRPRGRAAGLAAACVLALAVGLAACGSTGERSGAPAAGGTPGPPPSAARSVPQTAARPAPFPCTGWVSAQTPVYDRAGSGARRFGTVQPGDPVAVVGRDAAGWWAVAPGTAQAANVGPFRWRWLPPDTRLRLQGACSRLPRRVSPPPGVCFEMAMAATPIRAAPQPDAPVIATLPAQGYVAITGASPGHWLQVDAGSGSVPGSGRGWIDPAAVNVNGPCDAYLTRGP